MRARRTWKVCLALTMAGRAYVPLFLNCGLTVFPWFFTKGMRPVVAYLRERVYRVLSDLDDVFRVAATKKLKEPESA